MSKYNLDHPSSNLDSRNDTVPTVLVLHYTAVDFDTSLYLLTDPNARKVSSHYLVPESGIQKLFYKTSHSPHMYFPHSHQLNNITISYHLYTTSNTYSYGSQGTPVYQLVPEEKRAWHAGVSHWRGMEALNAHSIGVEIVNLGPNTTTPTPTTDGHGLWHPYPESQVCAYIPSPLSSFLFSPSGSLLPSLFFVPSLF